MIRLGIFQTLEIMRYTSVGAYLNDKDDPGVDDVLLPTSQIPAGADVGSEIEVFIYKDSEDRLIATTKRPKLSVGELAMLTVVETGNIGAFLEWGLNKDLFLPFKEQKVRVVKGKSYLVGLYVDNSERLCATTDIYKLLSSDSPYGKNDVVKGTVYSIHDDFGTFVAVDNKYHGLIPKKELFAEYKYGDEVEVRVKNVREDGKLELTPRREAHKEIDSDAVKILEMLEQNDGFLPLGDHTDPETIKRSLQMSKKAFKRAIGRLYKDRSIEITDNGIKKTGK